MLAKTHPPHLPPGTGHVGPEARAPDRLHHLDPLALEALDAAEVQEAHAPVVVEQVVAGVRIGVEQAEAVVGAVNETVDGLPPAVAQLLLGGEGVAPGFALNELLGQHTTTAQLADHLRDVDERVPAVELGELGLVGSLEPVVELLGDAYADLLRCAPKVEAHFPRGEANSSPRNVESSSVFFRSAWIAAATPGYSIFTATARPSCSRAA